VAVGTTISGGWSDVSCAGITVLAAVVTPEAGNGEIGCTEMEISAWQPASAITTIGAKPIAALYIERIIGAAAPC
jgi:hypothetical protein